jgi:protein-disulfide isomerase
MIYGPVKLNRFAATLVVAGLAATSAVAQEPTVKLPGHAGAAIGKPGAPIVLVEFTDIECPNCRDFHRDVYERLKQEYIDTGKVLFVHRDLPLPNHPNAVVAAHGLRCAGDQALFWQLRHALLLNEKLSPEIVELAARLVSVDLGEFRRCMRDGRHLAGIEKDIADARTVGAKNTPTLILGRMVPDGIEGVLIGGTATYEELDSRIKAALAGAAKK